MRALKALLRKTIIKLQLAWEWVKGVARHVTGR